MDKRIIKYRVDLLFIMPLKSLQSFLKAPWLAKSILDRLQAEMCDSESTENKDKDPQRKEKNREVRFFYLLKFAKFS